MAKKTVENQQPMSDAREAINDNFTELYSRLGGGGGGGSIIVEATMTEQFNVAHGAPTIVKCDTVSNDTHSAYDSTTGIFTAPYDMDIMISGSLATPVSPTTSSLYLKFRNQTQQDRVIAHNSDASDQQADRSANATCALRINQGDTIVMEALAEGGSSSSLENVNFSIVELTSSSGGSSGVGNLSVIQAASNYSRTLPDQIVCRQGGRELMLRLVYVIDDSAIHLDGQAEIYKNTIMYEAEDHGVAATDRRYIWFKNDITGDWKAKNAAYFTDDMSNNSLSWFIDNDRAVYGGGSSGGSYSTSSGDTWGVFDGTESGVGPGDMLTIQAGNNIQSIEYISTGMYEVTVINPMPSEFYHVSVGVNPSGYGGADGGASDDANGTYSELKPTASKFRIDIRDNNNAQSNSDRITFHVVC